MLKTQSNWFYEVGQKVTQTMIDIDPTIADTLQPKKVFGTDLV